MDDPKPDDRRRYPRICAPVYCRPARSWNLFGLGRRRARDISLGGIRLYSDEVFAVGSRLQLEVVLPDATSIELTARAVWVDAVPSGDPAAYDVGFEFVEISADDQRRLTRLFEPAE